MIFSPMNKVNFSPYRITLLALLAALAVVGRYAFVFLPNVQPVTSLIIICGVLLGPLSAVLLAILTTFLSNMLLGMGIWTIWQIVAWGAIGVISGMIGSVFGELRLHTIMIYSIFCGYFYGLIISLTTYQVTGKFWPYYILGLPMDTYHAIGNAIFMLLVYPIISLLFKKYSKAHL
ncbi:ECF transporter S component [Virgibacillus sp. W0181]|uniref:ECF transporter S component n=1 Tax=Virgibacillus sp. W0181 TaxID=3391581 RepID=UPI003F46885F